MRPGDGLLVLELGIVEKLLGRISLTFHLLGQALRMLPLDALAARQRALFVLGLTYGDIRRPRAAVAAFEAVVAEDAASDLAEAARGYAVSYRDIFQLGAGSPA
jgi:hypothetical protein